MSAVDTTSRVRSLVVIIIVVVWVTNIAVSFISERYEPNEAINALMMAVVGYLLVTGRKNGNKEDS